MKGKLLKKATALGLTLGMVLSLAACGGGNGSTSTEGKTTEGTKKETVGTAGTAETAAPENESEVIKLSTVKILDSYQTFVDCTVDDNIFQDDFLRDVGVDIEYKWTADITQTDAKFATMVASGDIPDYFNVANADLAFQLINDGYCMDITEVYNNTASDALKARDAAFPEAHESLMVDGKLYGISELGYGIENELNIVWIRSDWLESTGRQIPKTMDELFALAETFMDQIEGCRYGISLSKDITSFTEHTALPIMNANNAYAKIWLDGENGIEYGSVQPEMKAALATLQDLYSRGIIDPEFSVKDTSAVSEDVASGKVGIVCGVNWIGWDALGGTVALDPKATWTPIAVPTLEEGGKLVNLQSGWPVGGYWLISKDCENPEAVIRMMNYYVEKENDGTFNGEAYANAGGVFAGSPIYQTNPLELGKDVVQAVGNAIESGDSNGLTDVQKKNYDNCMRFLKDGDAGFYGAAAQFGPKGTGSLNVIADYVDGGSYTLTRLRGAMPEGYARNFGILGSLEDEYFTRIIMGEPVDLFDEFVEKWQAAGGADATAEINEMYGNK